MYLVGCSDFLDVNPKGEVFDNDMFESAEGYEDALYGIYAEMGTEDYLYSGYLYWLPEALSINATDESTLSAMAGGEWSLYSASAVRNYIWSTAYTVINHINNIIDHAEEDGEDRFEYSKLYKGEALALRAYLHFDLLRMYGAPVWASDADKEIAIPYVSEYSFDITPFSSFDEAYEKVIADLLEAERLLAADEELVEYVRESNTSGFTYGRIVHMNLYAVQALLARVYCSMNDLENAAIYAKKVIDSQKFTFRSTEKFNQPENGTLDFNETIFGLYSIEAQYSNINMYFVSSSSTESKFLLNSDYRELYLNDSPDYQNDYRLSAWFDDSNSTLKKLAYPSFYTSSGDYSYSGSLILGINMLRIPEMYYIMAEAYVDSNPTLATQYFDEVIVTRGLESLESLGTTVTMDQILAERRKEFYGEGQYWFDLKRLGKDIQVDVSTLLSGDDASTYTVPMPTSETEDRF